MDACRASSCCPGARSALWTEPPVVHLAREVRVVLARAPGAEVPVVARRAAGVLQRRWRSWISSPQRRLTRLSTPWTNEPLQPSTTNLNLFNTGFPHTGKSKYLLRNKYLLGIKKFPIIIIIFAPKILRL